MKYEQFAPLEYDRVKSKLRRAIFSNWYVDCDKDNIITVEFHGKFYDIDINGEVPVITCVSGGNENMCKYMLDMLQQ